MKLAKKIYALSSFLLITNVFTSYTMETQPITEQTTLQDYIDYIGNILLGHIQFKQTEDSPLQQLSPEIQSKISSLLLINNNTNSLEICGKTINALAQVNKELNELINNSEFCLKLIKHIAIEFNCSDLEAANILQTQEAKRLYELQTELYTLEIMELNFASSEQIEQQLKQLIDQNIDLEFTIVYPKNPTIILTPLAYFTMMNCPKVVSLLIEYGVNVNQENNIGQTALLLAVWMQLPHMVKILLDAGADPNFDNGGMSPLEAAEMNNNQQIIILIKNAIKNKKY